MAVIAVGGFQHETNTFAPSKAEYAAFQDGGGWPPLVAGDEIAPRLAGANIPAAGAISALHTLGHHTAGLVWGAASPSAHVTRDAYERIVSDMLARLAALDPQGHGFVVGCRQLLRQARGKKNAALGHGGRQSRVGAGARGWRGGGIPPFHRPELLPFHRGFGALGFGVGFAFQ